MEYNELLETFLSKNKSLLIAPAGYGKTYTIAQCVNKVIGKSLILTHTHAGIAALKKKLSSANISSDKYQVETITSYAQKYVKSYTQKEIPPIEDDNYWKFILEEAGNIFKSYHIKDVIKSSYVALFVDEYQDCTISQHNMIMCLSEMLPTHILGDPLQGIMNFGDELVDFETNLIDFEKLPELEIPYRWYQIGNNQNLGNFLKDVRKNLTSNPLQAIKLEELPRETAIVIKTDEEINDTQFLNNPNCLYRKLLNRLLDNPKNDISLNSLLILMPEYRNGYRQYGTIQDRAKFKNLVDYGNQLELLEAIDDKAFYNIAKNIDNVIDNIHSKRKPIKFIFENILEKLFYKTNSKDKNKGLNAWIKDNNIIDKKGQDVKEKIEQLNILLNNLIEIPSAKRVYDLLLFLKDGLNLKYKRYSLLKSVLEALCADNNDTVYKSMTRQRNKIRRYGRKVEGKCLGTTALTKGLEFETVAILDAHKFSCSKNLYVALTRASKNLIIFTQNTTLLSS